MCTYDSQADDESDVSSSSITRRSRLQEFFILHSVQESLLRSSRLCTYLETGTYAVGEREREKATNSSNVVNMRECARWNLLLLDGAGNIEEVFFFGWASRPNIYSYLLRAKYNQDCWLSRSGGGVSPTLAELALVASAVITKAKKKYESKKITRFKRSFCMRPLFVLFHFSAQDFIFLCFST